MNVLVDPQMETKPYSIRDRIQNACKRIPPLWSLRNFVAVNPFLGLKDRHCLEAAHLIQRAGHGQMLMSAAYYLDQMAAGRVGEGDLKMAVRRTLQSIPQDWASSVDFPHLASLKAALSQPPLQSPKRVWTFADFSDAHDATSWGPWIVDEISKWCSVYFDQGQSSWRMPWRDQSLFSAWKFAARLDANPELMGLNGFREWVKSIPEDPYECVDRALARLGVPEVMQSDFLYRALMSLHGWSAFVQQRVRESEQAGRSDETLVHLLAIRLVFDVALFRAAASDAEQMKAWRRNTESWEPGLSDVSTDLLARYVAQQALECAYQNSLIRSLKTGASTVRAKERKALQAVFCIDVRSEVYRRALEAQSPEIETLGFAGFFGVAMEYLPFGQPVGQAQCPVLLKPKFKIRESLSSEQDEAGWLQRLRLRQNASGAWSAFKTSAISCFSFVETAGLWFGVRLIRGALAWPEPSTSRSDSISFSGRFPKIEREACCSEIHGHEEITGLELGDQITVAAGALKNMGLVSGFARVVLICGHGSATTNNPYGSALDCGACGGHAGDVNARVIVSILNRPAVRDGLKAQGIYIPADTLFVAALHNTTTDEVVLYDEGYRTSGEFSALDPIRQWISAASRHARRERAAGLGLLEVADSELDERIHERSRDWSQVRPEWGLAGNAAFIAAPRELTQSLNLGGRVFLHSYKSQLDTQKSVLELILTAPVVVASWINLQYFGSTVDNRLFGSGNKVLHNVVGTFGVWQGNGGDLQPGLPLQSLHNGERWMHEPLRLSVWIEADTRDVDAVLRAHPDTRLLFDNGWIHLFSIEPGTRNIRRRVADEEWEEMGA